MCEMRIVFGFHDVNRIMYVVAFHNKNLYHGDQQEQAIQHTRCSIKLSSAM